MKNRRIELKANEVQLGCPEDDGSSIFFAFIHDDGEFVVQLQKHLIAQMLVLTGQMAFHSKLDQQNNKVKRASVVELTKGIILNPDFRKSFE